MINETDNRNALPRGYRLGDYEIQLKYQQRQENIARLYDVVGNCP